MRPRLSVAAGVLALAVAAAPALSTDGADDAIEAELALGATLFATVGCAGCHGAAGEGAGIAPALAGNAFTVSPGNVAAQILEGDGAMPPFGRALDDAAIAAIVNFVRLGLNGHADLIDAGFVAIIRGG
ncbi:MAG: c-type cytochrome [Bauldia sp.]|nr:c-type cytochrome [Bauldia sp.]